MTTRPRMPDAARSAEQGFALLMVLFLSAVIAISLAIALPRAAMQAQRVREERLIYRGEQYKRAVELYFRSQKRYPASLDNLEETNGVRFLRRRYKDPITGEDEWRLIHMGANGRFTDSLIYDTGDEEEKTPASAGIGGIQASAPIGSQAAQAMPEGFQMPDGRFRGADRARAVRQSVAPEIPGPTAGGGYVLTGAQQAPSPGTVQPYDPNDPYAVAPAGTTGNTTGQPGQPAPPPPGQYPGYSRVRPSQVPAGAQIPGNPALGALPFRQPGGGRQARGQNGIGQRPSNRIGGPISPGGAQGRPSPASQATRPAAFGVQGVGGQAASIIQSLLTSPRPGGLAGLRAAQQGATQQASFTGGIAGVATKAEDRGVKVYGGYEQYNQWEFVYDYRREANAAGTPGVQAQGGGQMPQGQPGLSSSGELTVTPAGLPAGQAPADSLGNAYPPGYPATPMVPVYPSQQDPATAYRPAEEPAPYNPYGAGGSPPDFDPARPAGQNQADPAAPQPGQPGYGQPDPNSPYGQPEMPNPSDPRYNQLGVPGVIPGFPGSIPPQPNQLPNQQNRRGRPGRTQSPFFPPSVFPGQPGYRPPQSNPR